MNGVRIGIRRIGNEPTRTLLVCLALTKRCRERYDTEQDFYGIYGGRPPQLTGSDPMRALAARQRSVLRPVPIWCSDASRRPGYSAW
jgi:hypothetical protein